MNETILIWGAGGVGGTVGAHLVRAGHDVLFVDDTAAHVEAMTRDGLTIEGPIEQFTVAVRALTPDAVAGRFGRILLCVKAHHTQEATRALLPHLADAGYVASFQNGLNEVVIGRAVGTHRVIGGFINFGADYLSPGRILFGGRGACVVGEIDGSRTERIEALHRMLLPFEPSAAVTGNIVGYLWGKLGYGALLFATAVTDDPIADVLDAPEHRALLAATAREPVAMALAQGVHPLGFDGFDPAAFAPGADEAAVAASFHAMVRQNRRSAKSHSGIWRDLAIRKRRTEVDAQLGPVIEAAASLGRAAPILSALTRMIHEIEDGRRGLGRANLDVLARTALASA